ncbi:reticulocyte-binding protein 2 homolog a-like isoform X2 [Sparus aurata]|uniref:reticulocyte-binding protein 2 homolog a-like isoform X2 n=1 Tax=Sparus aurata TaxID=8175 RepID=UPI0011C187A4|nr:reticulocyte-binding protein 2 homolog a-like isoform X2 [Sparus aurata]
MAIADQLVELMFSWIKKRENCAKKLKKLADELETLREKCNSAECAGSTVSVIGAASLIGAGVATFFTAGAAVPALAIVGGIYSGVGAAVSVTTKIIEHFSSSDTLKEAEKIEKENNETAKSIQNLFEQLKVEVKRMYPSANPDQVDRHVMTSFMGAVARRSGLKLNINFSQHESFYLIEPGMRQNSLNTFAMTAGLTVYGIFTVFSLKTAGKQSKLLIAEATKKLIKEMSAAGLKTAIKGGAMVVGGAVGMGFALSEAIDNWKDLIEKNHETEASRSLRKTADDILKMCRTLKDQFDNMRTVLEEMDRRQREEEERARRQLEEKEKARKQREDEVLAKRRGEEQEKAKKQLQEQKDEARKQREDEVLAKRRGEEEEKAKKQLQEQKDEARKQREDEVLAKRRGEEEEKAKKQIKEQKEKARRRQEYEMQTGGEQKKNSQQAEQTGGDQGDDERDDKDKRRDQEGVEGDSEEETEEEESKHTGRKKKKKCHRKNRTTNRQIQTVDQGEINQTPPGTIRIGLLNTRSMNQRTSRISELITGNYLDVFLTTETWLRDDTADRVLSMATPEGFRSHYQVRDGRRGGGVANQFSEELQGEQLNFNHLNITTFEFVVTVLQHDDWDQPVVIINVYHPPGYNQQRFRRFLDEFQSLLDEVKKNYSSIIVAGDFNIHVNEERRSYTDEFDFLLWVNNLIQHVEEPTHEGGNTLDLVITTNVEISGLIVRDDGVSDHYTVYFNAKPKDTTDKTEQNENEEQKRFRKM